LAEALISNNSERLKKRLNLHENWHHEEEAGYCSGSRGV
jgi:hypothetical protein